MFTRFSNITWSCLLAGMWNTVDCVWILAVLQHSHGGRFCGGGKIATGAADNDNPGHSYPSDFVLRLLRCHSRKLLHVNDCKSLEAYLNDFRMQ